MDRRRALDRRVGERRVRFVTVPVDRRRAERRVPEARRSGLERRAVVERRRRTAVR